MQLTTLFSSALHFTPSRLLKTFEDPVSRVGQPSVYEVKVSDVAPLFWVKGHPVVSPAVYLLCSVYVTHVLFPLSLSLSRYIHIIMNLNIFIRYVPHERERERDRDLSDISMSYHYSFYSLYTCIHTHIYICMYVYVYNIYIYIYVCVLHASYLRYIAPFYTF